MCEQAGCEKFLLFHIANAVLDLYSTERRKSSVSVGSTLNLGDQPPQKKQGMTPQPLKNRKND